MNTNDELKRVIEEYREEYLSSSKVLELKESENKMLEDKSFINLVKKKETIEKELGNEFVNREELLKKYQSCMSEIYELKSVKNYLDKFGQVKKDADEIQKEIYTKIYG